MKIRKQDLGVLFLYYIGYSWVRNCIFRLRRRPVTRFVTFHDISDESTLNFAAKLRFLRRYTNVVSLDEYFSGKVSWRKVNIVVTFDDGFQSWVSKAAPVLKELDIPAVFFMSSGFIGLSKTEEESFVRLRLKAKCATRGGLSERGRQTTSKGRFCDRRTHVYPR